MALKVQCLLKQVEAFSLLFSCSIVRAIVNYRYLNWIYSTYFIRLNKKAKAKWILVAIEKWRHFWSWKWAVILSDERKRYILVIKWIQTLNPFFFIEANVKAYEFFSFYLPLVSQNPVATGALLLKRLFFRSTIMKAWHRLWARWRKESQIGQFTGIHNLVHILELMS